MTYVSMSQTPFDSTDYTDGEIRPIRVNSPIWVALHNEPWANVSFARRNHFLQCLDRPHYFAGYIVSVRRGQIELTYIPFGPDGTSPGNLEMITVTLRAVSRFL